MRSPGRRGPGPPRRRLPSPHRRRDQGSRCPRRGVVVRSSVVGPPRVGRGNLRAVVLHWDAAERVVLALRVAHPVVGHLDAGQRRVPVEDDAEEVVGLALVPVVGRIDLEQRRDMRIGVRRGDLQPDPAVVGDRDQRVDGVQFAAGIVRVVHAADAQAQLEAQCGSSRSGGRLPAARGAPRGSARRGRRRLVRRRRRIRVVAGSAAASASTTSSK